MQLEIVTSGRIRRSLIPCLLSALMLGAPATVVYAQSKEDIAQAKERFIEGRALLEKGNSQDAIKAFEDAYRLSGRSEMLFYIAQAHEKDGQLLEAQKSYQRYLDENPDASNAEDVLDIIIKLSQRIKKEYARLQVTTELPARAVFVSPEDQPRCTTTEDDPTCVITLKPGSHKIIVKAKDMPSFEQEVTLSAGEVRPLKIKLSPADSAKILVKSDVPGATLKVGAKRATLPLSEPLGFKPGKYTISVTHEQAKWSGEVELAQDQLTQIYVPLEHQNQGGGLNMWRAGSYTAISLGVGLLIGGAWMGSQASDSFDSLSAQRKAGRVDQRLIDQGQSQQTAANVMLVTGTISLLGGGGLLAWDMFGDSKQDNPEPTPGSESSSKKGADSTPKEAPAQDDLLCTSPSCK